MGRAHQDVYVEWRGGTCRVKWWTGERLANGRKRFESKGGFTDEDEALAHGLAQRVDIGRGDHVSNRDGSTLMSDWLDYWLASLDHAHLTEKGYRSKVETHIRPYFKHVTVGAIDVIAYRAFRKHISGTVAPGTAKNIMMVLGMILDDAVPKLIKVSPVERNRKRGKYEKKTKERKKDVLPEVVERLALNAEIFFGYPGYVFVWTMATTGMRPAELYALTREYCYPAWPAEDPRADADETERHDEDLTRYGKGKGLMPAIRVERQVQHENGELRFFPPKYGSYRTLVVPPFLADMLEKLLASHDSKWVFPAKWGGSLGSVAFDYEYWRPIADGRDARIAGVDGARKSRAVIPEVPTFKGKRLYLLRHGHKAWLDEDGHSEFAVETRMGHEVRGMGGVYGSMTLAMERAIMKSLEKRHTALRKRLGGMGN
ncbi:tyrosine-type recombinase/integrase [Streptomyces griseus]|uniref:tyrosine-type recombinase/integrase n=1 Tax=Streptomyces griseus TaxID=1911 RepID=UPI00381CDB75